MMPVRLGLGSSSESITKQYRIRITTPPESRNHIWLEAIPRNEADAACISRVDIMLDAHDLKPFAIRIHLPGGQRCDVYQFEPKSSTFNEDGDVYCDFAKPPTPRGYTYEFFDVQALTVAPRGAAMRTAAGV